jgi:hypothetical protein
MLLEYRIERLDASGNRLPPVPAQMQGLSFSGSVNNGDEIRVNKGRWRAGTLHVKGLDNLTTGAHVQVKEGKLAGGCFVVVLLIALAFIASIFITGILGIEWPWES